MSGPLAGLRVVDLTVMLSGPYCTMLLADLGADVVKLEPPAGDESRDWGPPFWGDSADRISAYFAAVNRNKRSVVVDLRTDDGRELLDLLASRSDLLVHNARPSSAWPTSACASATSAWSTPRSADSATRAPAPARTSTGRRSTSPRRPWAASWASPGPRTASR